VDLACSKVVALNTEVGWNCDRKTGGKCIGSEWCTHNSQTSAEYF